MLAPSTRGLAARGYRVIAPDARGCGNTEAPRETESYDTRSHVEDAVALLDSLDIAECIVVGHDWGSVTAWELALRYPDRLRGVVSLSVPLDARPDVAPLTALRQRFEDSFFYILYFQEAGVAERELEVNPRNALERIYFAGSAQAPSPGVGFFGKPKTAALLDGMGEPTPKLTWLDERDLEQAASAFTKGGFRGALSRYRNIDRDWRNTEEIAADKVSIPALFITGERDVGYVYDPASVARMRERVTDLREVVVLPNAGHWVQHEAAAETTATIARFADSLALGSA